MSETYLKIHEEHDSNNKLISCYCISSKGEKVDIRSLGLVDLVRAAMFSLDVKFEECIAPEQRIDSLMKLEDALAISEFSNQKSFIDANLEVVHRLGGDKIMQKTEELAENLIKGEEKNSSKLNKVRFLRKFIDRSKLSSENNNVTTENNEQNTNYSSTNTTQTHEKL